MSLDNYICKRNLRNDVLAVCFSGDYIFIGMGCTLYTINKSNYEVLNTEDPFCPYSDKIHGILKHSENRIIVYGGRSIRIFRYGLVNNTRYEILEHFEIHRVNDWIIAAKLFGTTEHTQIVVLLAHNNLYIYDLLQEQKQDIWCHEKCLLYGGAISGLSSDDILVFSGTVFKEILIWKNTDILQNAEAPILHRLKGHNGVIFSVFYDPISNLICSTSDDRTVRLWSWKNSEVFLQTTMFGHTARVWRAMIKCNTVVSIGEDSQICIWSTTGELIRKIQAHHGAPIWSIDISEDDDFVITGAADGSVHLWPLNSIDSSEKKFSLSMSDHKNPKYVCFLRSGNILLLKELGELCVYDKNEYLLMETHQLHERYANYFIAAVSINKECIVLASIDGFITLYKERNDDKTSQLNLENEDQIMESRIFSMQWLDDDTLLICGADGLLKVVKLTENSFHILSKFVLPARRERWVTAAVTYKNLVICGDRAGSIFVYNLISKDTRCPSQIFHGVHGTLGVQSCVIFDEKLITMGRNGVVKYYKFKENKYDVTVQMLHGKSMPMGWVARMVKIESDYYILGFSEADFVVYSLTLDRMLVRLPCGGGHRSWDYKFDADLVKFVHIRNKCVHFADLSFRFLALPPIMEGFHTKKINCLEIIPSHCQSDKFAFISGSEDCTLRIGIVDPNLTESAFETVAILDGHLSTVKCLNAIVAKRDDYSFMNLVFTAGGRAQLKVWQINITEIDGGLKKESIEFIDLASFMLRGTDKDRRKRLTDANIPYDVDPETRFMDSSVVLLEDWNRALIFLACSDRCFRILSYDISSKVVNLENSMCHGDRCILKIEFIMHQRKIVVLTMATNGIVYFWNVDVDPSGALNMKDTDVPFDELKLHQCGINSYDLQQSTLQENSYLLATGGDDNLLNLTAFEICSSDEKIVSIKVVSQWHTSSTHSAQITGIALLDENKLISVGADQRVIVHSYSLGENELHFVNQVITSVSDAQGMKLCRKNDFFDNCCVYGCGIELVEKSNNCK